MTPKSLFWPKMNMCLEIDNAKSDQRGKPNIAF